MAVKLKDVAKEAGFSISTVSRVINGKDNIAEDTANKIWRTIEDLGYRPNQKTKEISSPTVTILYRDSHENIYKSPFYGFVIRGIEKSLEAYNCTITIKSVPTKPDSNFLKKQFKKHDLTGVIFVGCEIEENIILEIKKQKMPLVAINTNGLRLRVDSIMPDNINGAKRAVEHLINLGHKKIAFISGSLKDPSFNERHLGINKA